MRISMSLKAAVGLLSVGLLGFGYTAVAAESDQVFQIGNMMQFDDGTLLPGGATLVRGENDLSVSISASRLDKKAAHTFWWVIFNNPSACEDMCDFADLSNPDTRASVVYAGGFVTGDDRTATVNAHLVGGEIPMNTPVRMGEGLEEYNSYEAAVMMIIRAHGKPIPGWVSEQIGAFEGGCEINECADTQMVGFPPVL